MSAKKVVSAGDLAEAIARYVTRSTELQSRFLYPGLSVHERSFVYTMPLLKLLVEVGAATEQQLEQWTNEEADKMESEDAQLDLE